MENLLKNIEDLRQRLLETWGLLDIDGKKVKIKEGKFEINKPDFWNNQEQAVIVSRKVEHLEKEVASWENLLFEIRSLEELVAVATEEKDNSMDKDAHAQYDKLKKEYDELEFYVTFSGKYDFGNAILSIHAGTGGVDAQDWTQILERMYLRFCEKRDWKTEIIDRNTGAEAGIKSVSIHVSGSWAYGYLRAEHGVHRLVRISPFDAEGMRHTSFALVEVVPDLEEASAVEIRDEDLKIDTYRASGAGGQHVNKTESAIRITHKPSGIVVTCQSQRSQHQNKDKAMQVLRAKLYKLEEEKKEAEEAKAKGEVQKAEWGKQIRSYVMQPYQLVKDHRSKHETVAVSDVLDGSIEEFIEAFLRMKK